MTTGARTTGHVLLTVSGYIPDDLTELIATGKRPRADYMVLADRLNADLVDVALAREQLGTAGRWLLRLGGAGVLLGWYCHRHRNEYDVIITDGEQVGLPLALLGRMLGRGAAKHMMIVHVLSVRKKVLLIRLARLAKRIDRFVVYSSWQASFITCRLGVDARRVIQTTFMVDTEFFDPRTERPGQNARPLICSAGLERRDYETLLGAVKGLDLDVVIAAASPWSRRSDSTEGRELPSNVEVRRLDLDELRALYAASDLVVMPLLAVTFQAGITTILEAMSMEKPLICSATLGQKDTITDDVTGVYVPVGDPDALRSAIVGLLADDDLGRKLGSAARAWVIENADVERYADRLAVHVDHLLTAPGRRRSEQPTE